MLYPLSCRFLFAALFPFLCHGCRNIRLRISKPLAAAFLLASLAVLSALGARPLGRVFYHCFPTVTIFFFTLLFTQLREKAGIKFYPLACLALAAPENLFAFLAMLPRNADLPGAGSLTVRVLGCDLLAVLCLSAALLIRRRSGHRNREWLETLLFRHTYLWIALSMADVAFILLYLFSMAAEFRKDLLCQVCAMLVLCALFFISNCVFLAMAISSRERLKDANRILTAFQASQREYYQALLDQEQETKKYRHDMKNHFLCMESLAQHNKFQDLKDYIRRISKNISDTNLTCQTGNAIFDILLHHCSGECRKEGITFCVTGTATGELRIPSDDLCVLFSNLLTNAHEASRKAENEQDRKILVNIAQGKQYLRLSTCNYHKGREVNLDTPTSKQDAGNHGFGLKNIRHIAEKYGGNVIFTTKGDWLEIQVFIEIP